MASDEQSEVARARERAVLSHPHGPALVELFAQVDPWGLVDIGAPRDEYAIEVFDLMELHRPTAQEVLDVFWRWGSGAGTQTHSPARFGSHPGISRRDAERLADGIIRIRGQSGY